MNKSTKIWLNYTLGGLISIALLVGIYLQVKKQLATLGADWTWQTGPNYLLYIVIALMPVNLLLEAWKWHMLAASAQRISYRQALLSYIAGISFSLVTPNRIGEYPGRILYLKKKNTFRLISVSILGAIAQMFTLFIYGLLGLVYYNVKYPGTLPMLLLAACFIATVFVGILYWRFETWLPVIERIKWLQRFRYHIYGKLLKRFTSTEQMRILAISLLRYSVYTAQYLILLLWMNVDIPLFEGFWMCALFFWVIAVIPSVTLVELGERGQVGLYLFHHFSENTVGILGATVGVWCINLIVPGIIGSILLARTRLLR